MSKFGISMRWMALVILCLGDLMIVLDTTIVNVALPSIRMSLGFSETALVWVINAYLLTFGGFLLLGGRLGDLFGHRRLFVIGIILFTIASLLCGLANTQLLLVAARALQGIGGAVVSAVALSLIMTLFVEAGDRAKAMGVFGFVAAGGGSIGVFLGGILTNFLDWHWIFLVNIPIGILVCILSVWLLPKDNVNTEKAHLDVGGSITVTASLMLAVYAIINGNIVGWLSAQTLGMLVASVVLMGLFFTIESRVKSPLMPLHLFRNKNVTVANLVGILWAAAMFAWFFISALYLQFVLGYSPFEVGMAFLPANLIMAIFSLGISAQLVMKLGISRTLSLGLALAVGALLLLARAPLGGDFMWHVLPSMILLGFGAGAAFNPMLLAAMSGVRADESGIASGMVNTSFMMGGAVGLAILASIAGARTAWLEQAGVPALAALNGGYHLAFFVGAIFAGIAVVLSATLLRKAA